MIRVWAKFPDLVTNYLKYEYENSLDISNLLKTDTIDARSSELNRDQN
jgi:hypothetical protein